MIFAHQESETEDKLQLNKSFFSQEDFSSLVKSPVQADDSGKGREVVCEAWEPQEPCRPKRELTTPELNADPRSPGSTTTESSPAE